MDSPRIGPREVVYRDRNRNIFKVTAGFETFSKEYWVIDSGDRAGLVIGRMDSVLLVRQYRLLINRRSWEIPGGKVEEGETPEEAALRECQEETGLLCRDIQPLISFQAGLDVLHNPTHLYYTQQFQEIGETDYNPREVVEREWVPLGRCIDMVFDGTIVDSFSIIALLAYQVVVGKG